MSSKGVLSLPINNKKQLPSKEERHRLFGSVPAGKKTKPTEKKKMADLQNKLDDFLFTLDTVGIANVKHPLTIHSVLEPNTQQTIGQFSMYSSIDQDHKGTNMSRFTEQLEAYYQKGKLSLDLETLKQFTLELKERLESDDATIEIEAPFFFERKGPSSKLQGLNHVDLSVKVSLNKENQFKIWVGLKATVTTLCPCSKEISEYSAHNQRGVVTLQTELVNGFDDKRQDWKHILLEAAESNASARIHPVLKRPDEKLVTETAFENPRFVEDMVRLIGADLYEWDGCDWFYVHCRNEESIHLHDAIASLTFDKRRDA